MDDELLGLAGLALKNAFCKDFSALVNMYLDAGKGLDIAQLETEIGESTSVYGRDHKAEGDENINLWVKTKGGGSRGYYKILEALGDKDAVEVFLNGKSVFKRVKGSWHVPKEEKGTANES